MMSLSFIFAETKIRIRKASHFQRHVAYGAQISASVGDQILVLALSHLRLGPNTLLQHREGVLAPPAPLTPLITPLPWTHISNTVATQDEE